ncbi:GTA-gp10 family protein [Bradyrhizobium sp. AZCC 1699]|uniref:GTA-gp10 family protein n=1 Tax=Bradyrhizobium sp. AZCC 1699 TaxID=3117024 RepID=UPI002FEED870
MNDTSDCSRELEWPGGKHVFNLGHPWVRDVLSVRGLNGTPAACLKRFDEGVFAAEDVERILELGLIGGGLSRAEADSLIDQHVSRKPLAANAVIAFEILAALFVGREQGNADASA